MSGSLSSKSIDTFVPRGGRLVKLFWKVSFVVAVTAVAWFNWPAAVLAVSATLLAILHDKASTLIEISFGPLTAKLEREVSAAERLVEQLRDFAGLQAKSVLAAGIRTGRWAANDGWIYAQFRQLERSLRSMGVDECVIGEARSELVKYAIWDAASAALGGSQIATKDGEMLSVEWHAARGHFPDADPDRIESFLLQHELMNDDRRIRIDDMRWMIENGDIRDEDQFLRTQKAVEW